MLIETGLGKLNAASAAAATLSILQAHQGFAPACLNVGLAGSEQPIGSLLTAHSITDEATGKRWFLQQTWRAPTQTTAIVAVKTVDKPRYDYSAKVAFDMEAAGIAASATRYTTFEFVQCLKVVSDNARHSFAHIDKSLAQQLIADHCAAIAEAVEQLCTMIQGLPAASPALQASRQLLESICLQQHCTATQKPWLQTLLRQYESCYGAPPQSEELMQLGNTKALIAYLKSQIAKAPRSY